ncbi:catalase [Sinobaca qinghaiensis]|uniref:Catalase n=1 Tax=Sinobaca qinghaiensis TaxID=342944 RepID=A0A419V486_9BACL|nr:catalase [Sinobaca qinghaiensis]RKD73310.1 catalase [Sinobaca qinghaiensis]
MADHNKLTTNQGVPIGDNQNSRTAGRRGPALLEDYQLVEKLAHFDRERIPERVVHARGAGAHGVFKVKNSMKRYTKADFLQEGKETPVFARLSTVIHGGHSPETLRDPRGFSVKFYTEEGNYDFVGNNLPVFFIRDAIKFPDVIHSLKPDPKTNKQDPDRYWDFMSLTPESTNMMVHLFTDEGIPASFRNIRGSSVHAFKWINEYGNTVYVKKRWVPKEGIKNLTPEQASEIQAEEFQHATDDLYNAIEEGNFPEWDLYVQILDPADIDNFDFDPLDATKDWLEEDIPYIHVGTMTLNKNVDNYFAETEQVSFNPGVLVPGIQASEDKMLQGRIFSYSDTQRYRVGANYLDLPINCPFAQKNNNTRDGAMPFAQQTSRINYEPNRYEEEPAEDPAYIDSEQPLPGDSAGRKKIEKADDFGQAGRIYRSYDQETKDALLRNLTDDLGDVAEETVLRMVCNFYRADADLGQKLADKLNVDISPYVGHLNK